MTSLKTLTMNKLILLAPVLLMGCAGVIRPCFNPRTSNGLYQVGVTVNGTHSCGEEVDYLEIYPDNGNLRGPESP